jgi:hypothetical protein
MSSPQFETFLARLYSDREFLEHFMRSPEGAARDARLDHREQQAALAIDRAGLLMAARSYELKRQAHRPMGRLRRGVSWLTRGIPWLRRIQVLQR